MVSRTLLRKNAPGGCDLLSPPEGSIQLQMLTVVSERESRTCCPERGLAG